MRLLGVALASTIAALSAGCGDTAVTMGITARYSRFAPSAITVPAGVPTRFVIRNLDPIAHEWIVGDEALHERHRTGTEPSHGDRPTEQSVPAMGFTRTSVTFDEPGTIRFICHLPGHEAYGMVGTITVTDG